MPFSPANTASDPASIQPFPVVPRSPSRVERFFLLLLFDIAWLPAPGAPQEAASPAVAIAVHRRMGHWRARANHELRRATAFAQWKLAALHRLRRWSHTIILFTTLTVLAAWLFYWFGP